MILSIAGAFKLHDALISLWVLAVVFMSDHMTGYTAYEKAWILQRNMIVIPILLTGIFMVLMNFLKKHDIRHSFSADDSYRTAELFAAAQIVQLFQVYPADEASDILCGRHA